ncbi:class I SAM-dependent methyltransferase [Methylobacterium sp. AMS5]|uniref:methyltransferase domain-containing protein n=1 Tax=Methylobacterium sp. AMS5 TaxID=925818 RepID=UPI00074FA426|nr:class I SAM-dependent methyltransferase [Methylobacterium sp. AMS5]AMB45164.1 hypothetical protein Y590_09647 [Methylobacterium sp. AMS5]
MDRTRINNIVIDATRSVVQRGPFSGMKLINKFSWGDGDISTKLLGMYEQELHAGICRLSAESYNVIVDVGCAEGFDAVGLARIFDKINLHAFDLNPQALNVAREAAEVNGVLERIRFEAECTPAHLIQLSEEHHRGLAIIDCEGYELELLCRSDVASALRKFDFIIECHDFINGNITPGIFAHYLPTHNIEIVWAGGRNPNEYPILANLTDPERWGLVNENRMCRQHWLLMEAKTR